MKISHIDHINIVVHDLQAAQQFFEQLGLQAVAQRTLEGKWIDKTVRLEGVRARFVAMQIPNAQTVLELLSYDRPVGQHDPLMGYANQIGIRHFAFCVDDIDAWYQHLLSLGVECYSDVQDVPNYKGKRIVYFKGPEGIILELAQYPR